ncbi:hypothetical protein H6P81_000804 [Aristolochia fimbriata]|uniref:Uncharacterized protein n=1 Tax=Aristolochia fimbriata TaxID=158543 RepID=A0AAV7F8A0_ARIFI|nr:hypothetical protein H6P81_000804 [Aristolochia fimbriata]
MEATSPSREESLSPSKARAPLQGVASFRNFLRARYNKAKKATQKLEALIAQAFKEVQELGSVMATVDLTLFKQDIDELLDEFTENDFKTLADMKRIWLAHKFTFIYESSPKRNLAFFMQYLYSHTIGHMVSTVSLSRRLGGLYCLYCLYETQPFRPTFKIYMSLRELKLLRSLVVEAKLNDAKVGLAVVKRMLERNSFLFGYVDLEGSRVNERVCEVTEMLAARVKVAYNKLLVNTQIEEYLHMDLDEELNLKGLKKVSLEYAEAKKSAIKEARVVVGVEDIEHIAQSGKLIGDTIEEISEEWSAEKGRLYEKTGVFPELGESGFEEVERLLAES